MPVGRTCTIAYPARPVGRLSRGSVCGHGHGYGLGHGHGYGLGHGSGFCEPRPSGTYQPSQRRTSSVVVRRKRGGLRPRCSRERRPPTEPEEPYRFVLPVECPAHYCARRAAVPGGSSGTIECPARPGGAVSPRPFIMRFSGGGGARSWGRSDLSRRSRRRSRKRPSTGIPENPRPSAVAPGWFELDPLRVDFVSSCLCVCDVAMCDDSVSLCLCGSLAGLGFTPELRLRRGGRFSTGS